ncbi:MAG: SGNH/GDSL hydrolase family protein [Burkholderiaceae bacterium]
MAARPLPYVDDERARAPRPARAPVRLRGAPPSVALTRAAKLALLPLLLLQGRRVRATALRLPEAAGPRRGVVGSGPLALRLLIVGDSSAAGVGVATQDEALAGQLALALAQRSGGRVAWQLVATSGHGVRDALGALRDATLDPADLLVTAVGVNDVVGQTRAAVFLRALDELHAVAAARAGVTHAWHCGVPRMAEFPLLPTPLRWILGRDALALDHALARHLAADPSRLHVPLPATPEGGAPPGWMAEDGFHPGPAGYRHWGRSVVDAVG